MDEKELAAVCSLGEIGRALGKMSIYSLIVVEFIGIVGLRIQGVFQVLAVRCQLEEAGIGDGLGEFAVREAILHQRAETVHFIGILIAQSQQEEVVIDIIHLLKVGELFAQAVQHLACHTEVLDLLHQQDTAVIEPIEDESVGFCQLLLGERNLLQVIFAVMRVVLQRVLQALFLLAQLFILAHFIDVTAIIYAVRGSHVGVFGILTAHGTLVGDTPVVLVGTVAPPLLEILLALIDGHGIVKVEDRLFLSAVDGTCTSCTSFGCVVLGSSSGAGSTHSLGIGTLLGLLLLLLQLINHTVYGG